MTLSKTSIENFITTPDSDVVEHSNTWDSLYNSNLWVNSALRQAVLNRRIEAAQYVPKLEYERRKDCYLSKLKSRNYDRDTYFVPNNHSTPNSKVLRNADIPRNNLNNSIDLNPNEDCARKSINSDNVATEEDNHCIPSISQQIDSSFRHKFSSCEVYCSRNNNNRRIRKCGIKGIGCIVRLAVTDTPIKKRTQIQACSISIMIIAIIIISFVLVNFTSPIHRTNVLDKITVPTQSTDRINTSSIQSVDATSPNPQKIPTVVYTTTTMQSITIPVKENPLAVSEIINKIRKNIRTFPKESNKKLNNTELQKPQNINNRNLSQRFCTCQINEVCMLDEDSGTALCKKSTDIDDPTGCGGLCALETEACQLVDRARGVRVCRLLAMVKCGPDEWRCRNGLCVSATARCNGSVECYDRSDELYCDCDLTKQFRCGHSISCFPNNKICDGIIDCWDGYDEVNCTAECPQEQFTCTDGQCIVGSRFCDGYADCADGSDEPHGCDAACGAHEIRCSNNRCVPRSALCDGQDQCGDATDELRCS